MTVACLANGLYAVRVISICFSVTFETLSFSSNSFDCIFEVLINWTAVSFSNKFSSVDNVSSTLFSSFFNVLMNVTGKQQQINNRQNKRKQKKNEMPANYTVLYRLSWK